MATEVDRHIYPCASEGGLGDAVPSWEDCVRFGKRCVDPRIISRECFYELRGDDVPKKRERYRDPVRSEGSQSESVLVFEVANGDSRSVRGYQNFDILSDGTVRPNGKNLKWELLVESLAHLKTESSIETLLEFGCSSGLGALIVRNRLLPHLNILGVDHDVEYVESARKMAQFQEMMMRQMGSPVVKSGTFRQGLFGAKPFCENGQAYDVVVALAIVHWTFASTASFTLDAFARELRQCARHTVIVEWVDPSDKAIRYFGHVGTRFLEPGRQDDYSRPTFMKALRAHFDSVESIGFSNTDGTRELFRCTVDTSSCATCVDGAYVMSPGISNNIFRCLRKNDGDTFDIVAVESWNACQSAGSRCTNPHIVSEQCLRSLFESASRRVGVPCVYKAFKSFDRDEPAASWHQSESAQSTSFANELYSARLLGELDHFPRLLGVDEDSRAMLFDFVGRTILDAPVPSDWATQAQEIVDSMASKGIAHNDIHANNIMVDSRNKISLIDFSWASPTPYRSGSDALPPRLARRPRAYCGGAFNDSCFFRYAIEVDLPKSSNRVTRHVVRKRCEGFGTQASVRGCRAETYLSKTHFEVARRDAGDTLLFANEALGLITVADDELLCEGAFRSSSSEDADELAEYGKKYASFGDTTMMLGAYGAMLVSAYGIAAEEDFGYSESKAQKCDRLRELSEILDRERRRDDSALDVSLARRVRSDLHYAAMRLEC